MKSRQKIRMTQKEYSDTQSQKSIAQRCESDIAGAQRCSRCSDNKFSQFLIPHSIVFQKIVRTCRRDTGSAGLDRAFWGMFNVGHFISLLLYGILGLSSKEKTHFLCNFRYGASLVVSISYFVLYCTDVNKLFSSVFNRAKEEGMRTYCTKVGGMGIILPAFNCMGLIAMFIKGKQIDKLLDSELQLFLSTSQAIFCWSWKQRKSLNLKNMNWGSNALVDNSPAANSPVHSSPMHNSPAGNSPASNAAEFYSAEYN